MADVRELVSMGFNEAQVRDALTRTGNSTERALELLLQNDGASSAPAGPAGPAGGARDSSVLANAGSAAEQKIMVAAGRLGSCPEALGELENLVRGLSETPPDQTLLVLQAGGARWRSVLGAGGGAGAEFLRSIGYKEQMGLIALKRPDPALMWHGRAALEAARNSAAYSRATQAQALEVGSGWWWVGDVVACSTLLSPVADRLASR